MTSAGDEAKKSPSRGFVASTGAVALIFCIRVMADVLSARGLAYSFGMGGPVGLFWPAGTRLVTWLLIVELGAGAGVVANYLAGRWKDRWLANLLMGHVRFVVWIGVGLRFAARGLRACLSVGFERFGRSHADVTVDEDLADEAA